MIAILMLLATAATGGPPLEHRRQSIFAGQEGGREFSIKQRPRELIGAGQRRVDWVEVQLPSPSHRVDRIVTEGGGT